jgi:hypothetical protein
MSDGHPYWELGRIDSYISLNPKPAQLEIDLIQFVNAHSDVFSREEMDIIERGIIRGFAMRGCPFQSRGDAPTYQPGFSVIAQFILQTITDKATKREINTSQAVNDALTNFEVCVEFIEKFLPALCANESAYTHSGNGGFLGSNKWKCDQIADAVKQNWSWPYPNIFKTFQSVINRYQGRVLKLWADVLIRERKITPATIAQMQTEVDATDGYERKMRGLLAECGGGFSFKPNLDASMLLKWLTLFHVNTVKDYSMTNLTKTYTNGGHASTLDGIVFGIVSQFVLIHNASGYSHIIQGKKHESELNILYLTCNVIAKNAGQQPPVSAYLSSDVLDQCVQSVGHFPTTDEFIKYMNTRMIEKAAAFSVPPPPPPPPASAPSLSELDGGKRTRRKMNKKKRKRSYSRRR